MSHCQSPPTLDVIDATNSQLINKSIEPTYLVKQHKAKNNGTYEQGRERPFEKLSLRLLEQCYWLSDAASPGGRAEQVRQSLI